MTALVDPYAWPPHPMIAALQTRATTAEAKLSAVTALAHAALAKPSSCATRGLVSARVVLGVVEGDDSRMALDRMYHGICPKCGEDKFIGHGPLCVDCFRAVEDPS